MIIQYSFSWRKYRLHCSITSCKSGLVIGWLLYSGLYIIHMLANVVHEELSLRCLLFVIWYVILVEMQSKWKFELITWVQSMNKQSKQTNEPKPHTCKTMDMVHGIYVFTRTCYLKHSLVYIYVLSVTFKTLINDNRPQFFWFIIAVFTIHHYIAIFLVYWGGNEMYDDKSSRCMAGILE